MGKSVKRTKRIKRIKRTKHTKQRVKRRVGGGPGRPPRPKNIPARFDPNKSISPEKRKPKKPKKPASRPASKPASRRSRSPSPRRSKPTSPRRARSRSRSRSRSPLPAAAAAPRRRLDPLATQGHLDQKGLGSEWALNEFATQNMDISGNTDSDEELTLVMDEVDKQNEAGNVLDVIEGKGSYMA